MTNSLHPIKPGDPLRASTINKLIEGTKAAFKTQKSGLPGNLPGFDASNTVIRTLVGVNVPLPRYAVVAIDAAMFDPNGNRESFLQEPAVRVSQPNAETQNFAILQRPASPNQIVPACVSGVSIVELSVQSPEHQYAVPNAGYTMTTAESGGAKILWKQDSAGTDGKIWGLVLFPVSAAPGTTAPPVSRDFCQILTPVSNGFVNRPVVAAAEIDTTFGWNGARSGLGSLQSRGAGSPLRVYGVSEGMVVPRVDGNGSPLFYRSPSLVRNDAGFPVYDDVEMPRFKEVSGYGAFNGIAGLYGFLSSVKSETAVSGVQYDCSDLWETTTVAGEAVRDNLVVVRAHRYAGYWVYRQTFEVVGMESVDVSVGGRSASVTGVSLNYQQSASARMAGQVDWRIRAARLDGDTIEWETLENIKDWLDNQGRVLRIDVPFVASKPAVVDTNMITNMCKYVAAAGLWIDRDNVPQWVDCGVLPFNMGVACLTTACLYRISASECSPAYQTQAYPILLGDRSLRLGAVNYQPAYKPCK